MSYLLNQYKGRSLSVLVEFAKTILKSTSLSHCAQVEKTRRWRHHLGDDDVARDVALLHQLAPPPAALLLPLHTTLIGANNWL